MPLKLAIIAEYDPRFEPHLQTDAAIAHSAAALDLQVEPTWLSTEGEAIRDLSPYDAAWFAPGSPYRDLQQTLEAVRYTRENNLPTLGTCGGFQHLVIEFARNVLGVADAQHAEYDPYASRLIVSRLACSLVGREMDITLRPGSLAATAYGELTARERYYCNFGVEPSYVKPLAEAGLAVTGSDAEGECRVVEVPTHPFFLGTLFVPQARSQPDAPHPLITAFLRAASQG